MGLSLRNISIKQKGVVNLVELIEKYQSGDDLAFSDLFIVMEPIIKNITYEFTSFRALPFDELFSHLSLYFWKETQIFETNRNSDFKSYITFKLKRRALDFLRGKEGTFYKRILPLNINEDSSEEDAATFEIADTFNLEEALINSEEVKTDVDKRQLIDELVEKRKDSLTTAIVREYLSPEQLTPTAIGNKLGVHHEVVKRRIKSLSKNFDEKQFGNLDSYLAV
jgi:DNA-directed RNA polymerase specialized sigma subunit